jgi:hypothetical protein
MSIRIHLHTIVVAAIWASATAQDPPSSQDAAGQSPPPGSATQHQRPVTSLPPGPWGNLEYYTIPLTCPPESLAYLRTPSQQVEWCFHASNQTELEADLLTAGLSGDEIGVILKGANILVDPELMRVFPSDEAILGMSYQTRGKLYQLLGQNPENRFHRRPLYIETENLSAWFDGSNIPRPVIEDIAKLAYPTPRGRGFFFADLPFTLRRTDSMKDERLLLSGLTRRQALIVRLRLSRETLTPEIADYWHAGYKNKAVMPLLDAVVQANDGGAIDIAHLLPATPRQHLNRFPDPSDAIDGRLPDWFWTCYNFFRFAPRDIYADSPERDPLIIQEFEPTLPPLQFGDMVLLNSGSKIIHGCIHIADDIVFTKNGADLFSPWVLMRLEDVVASQDLVGDVSLSAYRKTPSGATAEP